jgi:uncharacterized protein YhaN
VRFRRLDMVRYGKFTHQSIELPRGTADVHLIFGPNEAGKSTLRNGIVELLYGINRTSQFNFVHEYSEMCISALIETDTQSLDFQRLKRNKNSLLDRSGNALPDHVLAPFLGGTDQEFFLRMFAIDHQNMVRGGEEILSSSGDLGQMLFQAAAGLGHFQSIREKLEAEADSLWGPKAKGSRAYNQALGRMEAAKARLNAVRVTANQWTTVKRKLDLADSDLGAAESRRIQLGVKCDRLERVQRVSPALAQLHDTEDRLAAIGSVTRLAANAAAELAAAEGEIKTAAAQVQIYQKEIEDAERDLAAVSTDASILVRAAEVERLVSLDVIARQAERDIPKREGETVELGRALVDAAAQIGWTDASPETIMARLPSDLLRAEIAELLKRHATLSSALDRRSNDLVQARATLQALDEEQALLPRAVEWTALAAALKLALTFDSNERSEELAAGVETARKKLSDALLALAPWRGDASALAKTRPIDVSETERLISTRDRLDAERAKVRQGIDDRRLTLAGLDTELQQERRDHQLATAEELRLARLRRDATFARIVVSEVTAQSVAAAYREEVVAADTLADRRYQEAELTARMQTLANHCEKLRAEIEQLTDCEVRLHQQLASDESAWQSRVAEHGLAGISLERLSTFLQQRTAALAAAHAFEQAVALMGKFDARAEACTATLRVELGKTGIALPPAIDLSALTALAADVLNGAMQNRIRHETINQRRIELRSKLEDALNESNLVQAGLEDWRRHWATKLAEVGLPVEYSPVAVSTAMDLFRAMDGHRSKIRDLLQNRIGTMRRNIEQFNVAVAALVKAVAAELVDQPAADAFTELVKRLKQAQADLAERTRLSAAIAKARAQLKESSERRTVAEAKVVPLLEQAGVRTIEDLHRRIAESDRALALDELAQRYRSAAIAGGGGMALEELERETVHTDLTQLGAELDAVRRQLEGVTRDRDECLQRRALAQAEYGRIAGSDEAAKAESERQAALGEMGVAADEYVRVSTGARLLKWALERYREEMQGPLLSAASEFFSLLTNGEHRKLLVESGETLRLISRRANGSKVGVGEMSDGTSDQLYLALRLAALQLHIEAGTSLPFVADDLLVNCDDERAASSFVAFTRLASRIQVLYLTHHRHLIDIAHRASNGRVNVVEIP